MRANYTVVLKGLMVGMAMAMATVACSSTNPAAPSAVPAQPAASSYELTGQVLGAGGAPVAGVQISLSGAGDADREDVTNDDGKFRFAGLEAGTYTVTLKSKGYADREVEIVIGGNLTITFDLIPAL